MDVTVAVATYGEYSWCELAHARALPSVDAMGLPRLYVHDYTGTLADARNKALAEVQTEWVIFLDADDELEGGYIAYMDQATADVRAPSVRYIRDGMPQPAVMPKVFGHSHGCIGECLPFGNWLVVGSAVRADLVRQVGGWREWEMFEDWDLWARCYQAGATFEPVPAAIYRAHVRHDSRNRKDRDRGPSVHRLIAADLGLPIPT